mgnify:CR=1 FL=1
MINLIMTGDPRYQPKSLIPFFGYDNLYRYYILVEFALLEALFDIGLIPKKDYDLLTPQLKENILAKIITTKVDRHERKVTKHDIRALVQLMQRMLPKKET